MNQTLIIAHLNYISQGQERIFEQTLNGFITPEWMKDRGMWICYGCGAVGAIDENHCTTCKDEKFIITRDTATFVYVKRKPYTRKLLEIIETMPNTLIIENYKYNDIKLIKVVKQIETPTNPFNRFKPENKI